MISLALLAIIPVVLIITFVLIRKRPKRINQEYYVERWRDIQSHCRNKKSWPQAVMGADTLLDEILKKQKFTGKSMGERMVAAQRTFSDNDLLWFAHNLSKKIAENNKIRLKEVDVKDALIGFRTALRDLGALPAEAIKTEVAQPDVKAPRAGTR